VIDVLEEAVASDQIGPFELNMLREGRKFGWKPHILRQHKFADPVTEITVSSCTLRHEHYNPGDVNEAIEAAKDLAYGRLNPYLIHHTDETVRQLRSAPHREKRVSVSSSGSGTARHSSRTVTEVEVYDYQTITEQRHAYFSLDDQIKLAVRSLLEMPAGYRRVRQVTSDGLYVSPKPEYVEISDPCPEQWFPGLAAKRYERLLSRSQESPLFHQPRLLLSCTPTPNKSKRTKKGMIA